MLVWGEGLDPVTMELRGGRVLIRNAHLGEGVLSTMLPVCTDDLYYKREADWVGHKFRPHPWRYQELLTPMGPEAYKAVYWDQD